MSYCLFPLTRGVTREQVLGNSHWPKLFYSWNEQFFHQQF